MGQVHLEFSETTDCIPPSAQDLQGNVETCVFSLAPSEGAPVLYSALPRHTQRGAGEAFGNEALKFLTLSKCISLLWFDRLLKG